MQMVGDNRNGPVDGGMAPPIDLYRFLGESATVRVCKECQALFYKPKTGAGINQWPKRRFCSEKCHGTAKENGADKKRHNLERKKNKENSQH